MAATAVMAARMTKVNPAITASTRRSALREISNDIRYRTGLRPLAAGDHQRGRIHHIRFQLHQAAHGARLAIVWGLLSLSGGAVHRDVRLPADDLSAFRLAR